MTDNTVVAVFDDYAEADRAVGRLVQAGIERDRIDIAHEARAAHGTAASAQPSPGSPARHDDPSIGERISRFFGRLFGREDHHDAAHYAEAIRRGASVVSVEAANPADADRVADILDSCGAVDIDQRASLWREGGWSAPSQGAHSATPTGHADEQVIPVVSEELQVGKRRRERGGVRIYAHLSEKPVAEQVRLREEHASVERRPADRPATESDFAAFEEKTIEIRESIEEPVVAKRARVVEEVVVGKETTERVETVNDVVRKGQVDVENVDARPARDAGAGKPVAAGEYDSDYRKHWQSNYRREGGAYEDYRPAYQYGSTLASDDRYRDRDWNEIESDARRGWEGRYPGSAWERIQAAVRHGRERVAARR